MSYANSNPPGVIIPLEWLGIFSQMSRELAGETVVAILTYCATGALPDSDDPTLNTLWPIFQARLDSDRDRYLKKVERSRMYQERRAAQSPAPAPRQSAPSRTSSTCRSQPSSAQPEAVNAWL